MVRLAGFTDIEIQKEREIRLPDELLTKHISNGQLDEYRRKENGIFSVTVFARKPNSL